MKNMKVIFLDNDGVMQGETGYFHHDRITEMGGRISKKQYYDALKGNWYHSEKEEALLVDFDWDRYVEEIIEPYSRLEISEDTKKTLRYLSKNYQLVVVSSGSERVMKPYFENNNVFNLFSDILGKESGLSKKDKMKKYLRDNDIDSSEALIVSDTLGDLSEASEIGINGIGILWGVHRKPDLKKAEPIRLIKEFKELGRAL